MWFRAGLNGPAAIRGGIPVCFPIFVRADPNWGLSGWLGCRDPGLHCTAATL